MTRFRFRLERVLAWRGTQLELAEAAFQRQTAAVAELDRARAALDAAGIRTEMAVRRWEQVTGSDLAALDAFRADLHRRQAAVDAQRSAAREQLEARRAEMLEARRRCRLLERLKERRLAEWNAEADREIEQLAGEMAISSRRARLGE
jgi:flagellar export protein FliJ